MTTRRKLLKYTALFGSALPLNLQLLLAAEDKKLITRAIPSTGE